MREICYNTPGADGVSTFGQRLSKQKRLIAAERPVRADKYKFKSKPGSELL